MMKVFCKIFLFVIFSSRLFAEQTSNDFAWVHWMCKGFDKSKDKLYKESISAYNQAIVEAPKDNKDIISLMKVERGFSYLALGNYLDAFNDFECVLRQMDSSLSNRIKAIQGRCEAMNFLGSEFKKQYEQKIIEELERDFPEIEMTDTGVKLRD